nr:MAG TPA: hypothetical protein [Caudoviricetes sp.]
MAYKRLLPWRRSCRVRHGPSGRLPDSWCPGIHPPGLYRL